MSDPALTFAISPGRGLGWITLGASLHGILTRLKAQPQHHPHLDLAYSATEPILSPIVLTLPTNGIRLRFDGPDQRLRLVEILDFSKSSFTFKSAELVRRSTAASDITSDQLVGPSFKHLYNRLFGPSYPGEYIPPKSKESSGTYVLSWPGLSATFSLRPKAWSEKADFVTLLSSSAASPAISLAIFSGSSWSEARSTLYSKKPNLPRTLSLTGKQIDQVPDEIEEMVIHGDGRVELFRRASAPLMIVLNETTAQDLVAEIGPPDAIFRKMGGRISIQASASSNSRIASISPLLDPHVTDQEQSSAKSFTDDSENEISHTDENGDRATNPEAFYNYFHHGFDALISTPQLNTSRDPERSHTSADCVVTKLFLHGNIPGSYAFNRHRRTRWRVAIESDGITVPVTSEMRFTDVSGTLKQVYEHTYRDSEEERRMQRGMVLNRGWGDGESPESSIELLGDFEEGPISKERGITRSEVETSMSNFNNTELFGFPGLLFEVLKNDTIACLTVYQSDP